MGQVFGNLTKTGVQSGGGTQYFDNPGEAAIYAAKHTKAPTTVLESGGKIPNLVPVGANFNPDNSPTMPYLPPSPVFGDDPSAARSFTPETSGGSAPMPAKPSFQEAARGGFLDKGLTTKGKVLAGLLTAAQGAAMGAGQPSFGAGFERATLFPLQQRRIQQQIAEDDLNAQAQRQAIEQAPVLFKSRVDAANANAEADKARGGFYRAKTGEKIATPTEELAAKIAAAQANGLKPGTAEYQKYVYGISTSTDNSVQPYEDFRKSYPDTAQGRAQAARDWAARNNSGGEKPATKKDKAGLERWKAGEYEQHSQRMRALQKKISTKSNPVPRDEGGITQEEFDAIDHESQARIENAYNIQKQQLGIEDAPPSKAKTTGGRLFDLKNDKVGGEMETQTHNGATYQRPRGSNAPWKRVG